VLITNIIALLLFLNSISVLCEIFSYDFPMIRNLPKIFPRSLKNVSPGLYVCVITMIRKLTMTDDDDDKHDKARLRQLSVTDLYQSLTVCRNRSVLVRQC